MRHTSFIRIVNNGLLFWYLIIRSPKITGKLTSSEVKTKQTNKQANTHTHTHKTDENSGIQRSTLSQRYKLVGQRVILRFTNVY